MYISLNLILNEEIAASNFIIIIKEVLKASKIFLNAKF